jgi:hypothetical protein
MNKPGVVLEVSYLFALFCPAKWSVKLQIMEKLCLLTQSDGSENKLQVIAQLNLQQICWLSLFIIYNLQE